MSRKLKTIQISKNSLKSFQKMDSFLLGSDLVLMLLSISPVKGKTKLQKKVFLTWKTIFPKKTVDPGFFPYKFGAYSQTIEDAVQVLQKTGLLKIKPGRGEALQYSITPSGKRKIKRKIRKMNIDLRKLRDKKIDWDEWTTKGIMRFVYRNYPEYTSKTKVPSLKW